MPDIFVGGDHRLTLEQYHEVARKNGKAKIAKEARGRMVLSLNALLELVNARLPVYGLNTQFGNQANLLDPKLNSSNKEYFQSLKDRQLNLVRSHNIGLGEETPEELVRGAMLLRAHCLAQGHSGVRPAAVEALLDFLNKEIHPVVLRYGSIGASGDLIPLAGIASALVGEKGVNVNYKGKKMDVKEALKSAKLKSLDIEVREGLALINGTSFMTAIAGMSLYDLTRLFPQMLASLAMALESLSIIGSAYNPLVHELKRHKGEMEINDFFVKFWKGNKLVKSLTEIRKDNLHSFTENGTSEETRIVQDYYSLRSVPQGFGPFKENLERAQQWIENEMNSVNDNPIITPNPTKVYHTANFMGYYVTEACDMLKMDIAQASTWIHAVLANMVHPRKNSGLPTNLVRQPEMQNGFRPIQLLAAALAVQNRKLAQAHQAYMIPTEGDNQDVNSLATHAAFDFKASFENLERLVAILFLAAAQALELRGISKASIEARRIHKEIRKKSSFIDKDRLFGKDIEIVIQLMRERKV